MLLVLCSRSSMRPHVCCIPSSRADSLFRNLGSCMISSPCTCAARMMLRSCFDSDTVWGHGTGCAKQQLGAHRVQSELTTQKVWQKHTLSSLHDTVSVALQCSDLFHTTDSRPHM